MALRAPWRDERRPEAQANVQGAGTMLVAGREPPVLKMVGTRVAHGPQAPRAEVQRTNAWTVWVCSPNPSMPRCITSPGRRKRGAGVPSFYLMPMPTPGGVPVVSTSPGSSVMNWLT